MRATYMKAYRLKHQDKLREYERVRSRKRRATRKSLSLTRHEYAANASKIQGVTQAAKLNNLPVTQARQRCMAANCTGEGWPTMQDGYRVWLCREHGCHR